MAQIEKLEEQIEIKSSTEFFFGFFKNQMERLVQMFPEIWKRCEIHGGGHTLSAGTVMSWKYDLGSGTTLAAKVKVEAVDEENKSITFVAVDGDLLKVYNSIKSKLDVFRGSSGSTQAKWSIEFEKANQNAPDPCRYLDFAINISKGIDAYLYNQMN